MNGGRGGEGGNLCVSVNTKAFKQCHLDHPSETSKFRPPTRPRREQVI
jgi:hypothetical protein